MMRWRPTKRRVDDAPLFEEGPDGVFYPCPHPAQVGDVRQSSAQTLERWQRALAGHVAVFLVALLVGMAIGQRAHGDGDRTAEAAPVHRTAGDDTPVTTMPVAGVESIAALGDVGLVPAHGSATWQVQVEAVNLSAWGVLSENSTNRPPAPGNQYVLVTLRLGHVGPSPSSPLRITATDLDGTSFDDGDACGSVPAPLPTVVDAVAAEVSNPLNGNICWSVPEPSVPSLVLHVVTTSSSDAVPMVMALR